MRSGVLIALIVCGTLLLAGPALLDYFRDQNQMALSQGASVSMWTAGILMILGGIIGTFMGRGHTPKLDK